MPDELPGPGPQVSGRLGYLLKHAALRLEELNAEALEPFGISGRQLAVLLLVAGNEPDSQQRLVERLGVDRTSIVALLDTLEREGLVFRRPDSRDRRRNVVELTDAGREILPKATRASDEAESRLLATLDRQDAKRLREMLRLVVSGSGSGP